MTSTLDPLRHRLSEWVAGPAGTLLVNGAAARIPQELMISTGQRVLDVGCGRGSLLRLLDERVGFRYPPVGVETARPLLRRAVADEAGSERPLLLAQASPAALPFPDGSFEVVTCGYVLRSLDDSQAAAVFTEVRRVLRGGGLALLWDFAPTRNARLDHWNRRWLGPGGRAAHLRTTRELMHLARHAGFPFARPAQLRPFVFPPIPRASVLVGLPPEGYSE